MSKHKGQNGILYVAAGSKQYHGALWYAIMAAEPLVDLMYVDTDISNHALVQSLKQLNPAIILVPSGKRATYLAKSDAVLLGPGLGRNVQAKRLVSSIMQHPQRPAKIVLDADGLYFLNEHFNKKWLTNQMILTPHGGEYRRLFGNVTPAQASRQVSAVILAKGERSAVCQNGRCEYNTGGIRSLTKGGIGDVLAGTIAGLACTQSAYSAAKQGSRVVAAAERQVYQKFGRFTTTRMIIGQLPLTYRRYLTSVI